MAYTFDSALDDPDLTVIKRDDALGLYTVKIGGIDQEVTFERDRSPGSTKTGFSVSHAIKTPEMDLPYRSLRKEDDPAWALRKAVSGLTSYYRLAVRAGHVPSPEWLVTNTHALAGPAGEKRSAEVLDDAAKVMRVTTGADSDAPPNGMKTRRLIAGFWRFVEKYVLRRK